MLFSGQSLARGWHETKRFIGNAYHHTTKLASQLDTGMQIGKRLLASVEPLFSQFGGSHHLKPIMSGISAYDQGKADVMHGYNNIQTHLSRIRRQVPELQI